LWSSIFVTLAETTLVAAAKRVAERHVAVNIDMNIR
jgi:hypothetical protein